jgi:hypothetical protein
MKTAKIISLFGTISMSAIILWALFTGDFSGEGNILLGMPWGIVSLVDLYIGFFLFSLWIIYREKNKFMTVFWVFLMLTLGFFTGSLYVILALQKSRGNWQKFFLGKHYPD